MRRTWLPCFLLAFLAGACASTPDYTRTLGPGEPALIPLAKDEKVPDFSAEWRRRDEILPALAQSLAWMRRPHAPRFFPAAGIEHARALASLERFEELLEESSSPAELQAALEREFQVYKSAGWDGKGGGVLFTAYCTPILRGSLVPDARYRYPLYALPDDLVKDRDGSVVGWKTAQKLLPRYPSRVAIEASGMLRGKELVWLADPLDAYLAHVNGSAFIELTDGTLLRLGYAGKNGRPYTSLGKELVAEGKLPQGGVSLGTIRAWAAAAPAEEVQEFLGRNQSYVFFTPIEHTPHGSLDVPVTPGRTVATDKTLFPRAALVFAGGPPEEAVVNRFHLDQDTGGAIRTAGRADLYLGVGPAAEDAAGRTEIRGQLYYLFLRER